MSKSQMINEIISAAKSAAILQNKHFDGASIFFKLAFASEKSLRKICKGLNIV